MEPALLAALAACAIAIAALIYRNSAYRHKTYRDATERAYAQLETWRQRDLAAMRAQHQDLARAEALVQLDQWKADHERTIRLDAIKKSQHVTMGKVTEHFVPYLPDFPFNPKDARFIGTPIDFIVFDGLTEGEIRNVVFVEVKTGPRASLTTRERRVRDAVEACRVEWVEVRSTLPSPVVDL